MILTQAFGGVMRKRLFAVVHALLLLQFVSTTVAAANVVPPSDALWRFDTQG